MTNNPSPDAASLAPKLSALLERVEGATGPNYALDGDIHEAFYGVRFNPPHAFTSSIDTVLALVEGSDIDAVQLLHEALEDMSQRGWKGGQPVGPQIARYLIAALLRSIIASGEGE